MRLQICLLNGVHDLVLPSFFQDFFVFFVTVSYSSTVFISAGKIEYCFLKPNCVT